MAELGAAVRERLAGLPGASGVGPGCDGGGLGRATWRTALFEDTLSLVGVIDRDGRFLDANRRLRRAMGVEADGSVEGIGLGEVLPVEVAEERLGLIRMALAERRRVDVVGMLWGVLRHSAYRPIPGGDGELGRLALAVTHPVSYESELTGDGAGPPTAIRARYDDLGRLDCLTGRELEVLSLIGRGLSTHDIAKRLCRSEKTVEWHRASLGQKLGVTNRVQLARVALESGLALFDGLDRRGAADRHGRRRVVG